MSDSDAVLQGKSFFASLFDISFRSFVTLRFIKVLYVLLMIVVALAALIILIGGLTSGSAATVLLSLIIAPVFFLIYLILIRVGLELIVVIFRIGENTSILVHRSSGEGGSGQAPPPPPAY